MATLRAAAGAAAAASAATSCCSTFASSRGCCLLYSRCSSSSSSSRFAAAAVFSSKVLRFALQPQQPLPSRMQQQQSRSVSSSSASSLTESLSATIHKEIAHEKSQYEADKDLKSFVDTKKWAIEDKPNDMLIVLSKEVEGRRIAVEFSCIQPSGAEDGEPLPEASDFTVCVSNKNGSGLLFYCSTTNEDEGARFCIGQVRFFADQQAKDSLAEYPGPYFEDLDDGFQQQLDSWLSSLGIDGDLCDFVDKFASDKENREYIKWLEKLGAFIKETN